ncbi:MAG: hypothetical protein ACPLN1_01215 [Caldisericia bacterium]
MINRDEIKKILETIDAFKLISIKAESEKKEFARYSFIWGLVMFIIFAYFGFKFKFLGNIPWLYIFLIGAFFSTLKVSNFIISGLTWGLTGLILTIIYYLFKNYTLFQILFVLLIFFSYSLNYFYQEKYKKEILLPLKLSVSAKVGISWAIITSGMGFVFSSLIKYFLQNNINLDYTFLFILLFGFITSVGIFMGGLIITTFFIIGLIGIFGIPLLSLLNINYGVILASLVPLLTSIVSGFIYFKKES